MERLGRSNIKIIFKKYLKNLSPQAKETWFWATIVNANECQQSGRTRRNQVKSSSKEKCRLLRLIEYFLKEKCKPKNIK